MNFFQFYVKKKTIFKHLFKNVKLKIINQWIVFNFMMKIEKNFREDFQKIRVESSINELFSMLWQNVKKKTKKMLTIFSKNSINKSTFLNFMTKFAKSTQIFQEFSSINFINRWIFFNFARKIETKNKFFKNFFKKFKFNHQKMDFFQFHAKNFQDFSQNLLIHVLSFIMKKFFPSNSNRIFWILKNQS